MSRSTTYRVCRSLGSFDPSGTTPVYTEQTGSTNPFNGIDIGDISTPTFADIDGDGDLDAIVGEFDGTLNYYKNTGSRTAPVYTAQTGSANPFNGIDVGNNSKPTFADLDGDGDLDAIVGGYYGTLNYYKNTGTSTAPTYAAQPDPITPFNGIDIRAVSSPTLVDLDGDGDLDAIVGEGYGTLKYYLSVEPNLAPTAVALTTPVTTIAENTSTVTRIKVADISITDDALGTNTIALTGADVASFEVDGTELYLKAGVVLNYETKTS